MGDLCQISGPAIDSYVSWGKAISISVISLPDCKTKMVFLFPVYNSTMPSSNNAKFQKENSFLFPFSSSNHLVLVQVLVGSSRQAKHMGI